MLVSFDSTGCDTFLSVDGVVGGVAVAGECISGEVGSESHVSVVSKILLGSGSKDIGFRVDGGKVSVGVVCIGDSADSGDSLLCSKFNIGMLCFVLFYYVGTLF